MTPKKLKIVLFANTDWYLYNFRKSLALALVAAGYDVLLISPPGEYGAKLHELGLRWVPVPMKRRSMNPLKELALLHWLRTLIVQEQVDLLHNFTIKCVVYGSLAARLVNWLDGGTPRVNAVAGMGYVYTSDEIKAKALKPLVTTLMRLSLHGKKCRLILQNPDDIAFFESTSLIKKQHIRLVQGSGADCNRFTPSLTHKIDSHFRVLLPARLLWDKGIKEYVSAAEVLKNELPEIEFLIAGDCDTGNPASIPLSTVRSWVESGIINWLGHVEDMPHLFNSVDAVVLPSYREGLPKGLIEAGACGLPLVTTDVPGCREVVTHEVDGLLIPARDSNALANAIRTLYHDRALGQRIGAAARIKALTHFDERLVINNTLDVYKELL